MKLTFDLKEAVTWRRSFRTFTEQPVSKEVKDEILAYADTIEIPFGPKVRLKLIEKKLADKGEKLGTYGLIKGAGLFLGTAIKKEDLALESLGYQVEQLVLYLSSKKIGTCWLGGTFNRSAFAEKMDLQEGELFPIISPIGYPKDIRMMEKVFRSYLKADDRLPWKELFFYKTFDVPLSDELAGEWAYPLEMLRQAPSAVNKQPWRVVVEENAVHFYRKHLTSAGAAEEAPMQKVDVGIGINHFHLAVKEQDGNGKFIVLDEKKNCPEDVSYVISWVKE